jgi:hypothetical protein
MKSVFLLLTILSFSYASEPSIATDLNSQPQPLASMATPISTLLADHLLPAMGFGTATNYTSKTFQNATINDAIPDLKQVLLTHANQILEVIQAAAKPGPTCMLLRHSFFPKSPSVCPKYFPELEGSYCYMKKCPSGYKSKLDTCVNGTTTIPRKREQAICSTEMERRLWGYACYKKCPDGKTAYPFGCTPAPCPKNTYACGPLCTGSQNECTEIVNKLIRPISTVSGLLVPIPLTIEQFVGSILGVAREIKTWKECKSDDQPST